eukprot:GHVO01036848.1.p1 GENE.GHVO01036848.1~~GHVO01036848.1.p1  ORF type:complete len:350 (+),score=30.42 GHVO01036848.1:820-1869(+)
MQSQARSRLSPLFIPPRKDHVESDTSAYLSPQGSLSPDIQLTSPPSFPTSQARNDFPPPHKVSQIGRFFLASPVDSQGQVQVLRAVHVDTQQQYYCKVFPLELYRQMLSGYWRVGSHEHINEIEEIILGETKAYVFFPGHYGDLHSYVRSKKRLRESQAVALFEQIVSAAAHCHENGVVLRDLKLRKFVFKDPERTQLKLEGLEDACVLDDDNDLLEDKHGCPAYVSPEILDTSHTYSGKAADSWSLGVMLYTMLAGRYPFHDTEASILFSKIRRGMFTVPDNLSSRARCLIRSLLRRHPHERLSAVETLDHPWFSYKSRAPVSSGKSDKKEFDQTVPSLNLDEESLFA